MFKSCHSLLALQGTRMLRELFLLIPLAAELIVPLVEIGVNIWNVVNINEMIKDPESGYGKEFIFDAFFAELDPWVESPTGKCLIVIN